MTSIPFTNAVTTLRDTAKYTGIRKKSILRDSIIKVLMRCAPDIYIYINIFISIDEQVPVGCTPRGVS